MSFQLTWYGHAALGLDIAGIKLLVDPFLSENPLASISPDEVQADYILISHGHGDHVGDAVEIAHRTNAMVIANFEVASWFEKQDIEVHPQHIGGGHHYPFGYLKLTIAHHGSSLPDGSYGGNPAGFLLTLPTGEKIYLAADTGLFGDMRMLGEEGILLAVIPIGDNFTMGPDDALRAVKLLEPDHVIPIHYNTFDVIKQDPFAWAKQVSAETSSRPHVLSPGDTFSP